MRCAQVVHLFFFLQQSSRAASEQQERIFSKKAGSSRLPSIKGTFLSIQAKKISTRFGSLDRIAFLKNIIQSLDRYDFYQRKREVF